VGFAVVGARLVRSRPDRSSGRYSPTARAMNANVNTANPAGTPTDACEQRRFRYGMPARRREESATATQVRIFTV
jgi:hypothetical protein